MKITIGGDFKMPVLFSTDKATSLLVETDDGTPAVLYKFFPNGKGYVRLTRGEDKDFDFLVKQLDLK